MKRKNEEVPGFDEIIFKDRNKEYGAYRIRKGYNKSLGISLLGGVALAVALVVLPSLTVPRETGQISEGTVIMLPDLDLEKALQIKPQEIEKPPSEIIPRNNYVPPQVVSDTSVITNPMMPTDATQIKDGIATENPPEVFEGDGDGVIPPEPYKKYVVVQEMPSFPGGESELMKYIYANVVYPEEALDNKVEGRVIVRFVVSPTGDVTEIEILKSTGNSSNLLPLENEAKRVIGTLPTWKPGKQNGVAVPVYYTVPVTFSIRNF